MLCYLNGDRVYAVLSTADREVPLLTNRSSGVKVGGSSVVTETFSTR